MALDFPSSPTTNQTYTSGNKTWIWNGTGWIVQNATTTVATLTGSETLTNKTLTSPTITGGTITSTSLSYPTVANPTISNGTLSFAKLLSSKEVWNVSVTAATGSINYDISTQNILYYTTNASANFTLNFRGNSTTTLSSLLDVNDSIAVVFMNTNGTTAYYPTTFSIDGVSITPKWQGGTAPTAGSISAIDAWSFEIVKTAATPNYVVFASQVKYA